jgi:hypothetical protein
MSARILILTLAVLAACSPRRVHERPILANGDRVPSADATVASVRSESAETRAAQSAQRDSVAALALATCAPAVCDAIARGEVAIGMTEAQVLAATGTTTQAWTVRVAGPAAVRVPRSPQNAARDAVGEVAMVQLRDGCVAT